jgi:hypothetical protein
MNTGGSQDFRVFFLKVSFQTIFHTVVKNHFLLQNLL